MRKILIVLSEWGYWDKELIGPPYLLEYILRDATGPNGGYHGNVGRETSVIPDYPFITGRSTPDAYLTGQMLVEVLDREGAGTAGNRR